MIIKQVEFLISGIDRQPSTSIERGENQPPAIVTASHPMSSTEIKIQHDNERMKVANLTAQAAERRLSANKFSIDVNNNLIH
jgi:hypothetical protein